MKNISKPAICSLILGIIFTVLAVIINGGILYAMIAAGLFVAALSLQICRTKPIVCTCFNLLLYVIALIDFLFIGTVKHAVLIDILLIVSATVNFIRKLPRPGIDLDAAGDSKFKAACISCKLGLKEYFNKKGEE